MACPGGSLTEFFLEYKPGFWFGLMWLLVWAQIGVFEGRLS